MKYTIYNWVVVYNPAPIVTAHFKFYNLSRLRSCSAIDTAWPLHKALKALLMETKSIKRLCPVEGLLGTRAHKPRRTPHGWTLKGDGVFQVCFHGNP